MTGLGLAIRLNPASRRGNAELVTMPYTGSVSGGWTITAAGISRNGAAGGSALLGLVQTLEIGANYRIQMTVAGKSGDDFFYRVGAAGTAYQVSANGSIDIIRAAGGSSAVLSFGPWAGAVGDVTITGLSVIRV